MKSSYKKPMLAVGSLSLAQSSARDCWDGIPQDQVNINDAPKCGWDLGGMIIFVPGTVCTEDGDSFGFACYNNPGDGFYMFRS